MGEVRDFRSGRYCSRKILRGVSEQYLIHGRHPPRIQKFRPGDSIVAFRRGAEDFFNSIGPLKPLSEILSMSLSAPFLLRGGRNHPTIPQRLWDRGAQSRPAHSRFFPKNRKRSDADSIGPSGDDLIVVAKVCW